MKRPEKRNGKIKRPVLVSYFQAVACEKQCHSVGGHNRNTELYPVDCTQGNLLSEPEKWFHLDCKKEYSFRTAAQNLGNPSSAFLVLGLWSQTVTQKKAHLCFFIWIFIYFFAGGYEKDDTEHSKLSQGISTVITLGIWGRISPLGEKKIHKRVLDNNTGKINYKEKRSWYNCCKQSQVYNYSYSRLLLWESQLI